MVGPGDRAARPDELRLVGLPHAAAAVPDLLDRQPAARRGTPAEIRRARKRSSSLDGHRRLLATRLILRLLACRARAAGLDRIQCRASRKAQRLAMNIQAARTASRRARAAARERRAGRGADAQPAGGAQQPVRGAARARSATRSPTIAARQARARRGARRERPGLLRRPRPQGADRAAQRCRPRPRLFPAASWTTCSAMMQQIVASAAAGDRRGAGRGDRGRLPAGGKLRSRGRLDRGELRHARRQHRPVLLDADGGAVAQRRAQARDGDAAHRRHRSRPRRPQRIGLVNASSPPGQERDEALELAQQDRVEVVARRRASARRRSTASSKCSSPRPTATPPR